MQVGYAAGILFLVPLSERVQPRRQITVQVIALAVALLVTASLPSVATVALGFAAVGLVANIAQLIIPAAGKLAPADRRGATTAALVGALLCGIFGPLPRRVGLRHAVRASAAARRIRPS